MDILPNELLIHVASYLDNPPPSVTKFANEPSSHLTYSDETPLKNLSQTSHRWRKIVLPILFHYSRIPLDRNPQWVPIDARILDNMQSELTKLSNHELQVYRRMRSTFKSSSPLGDLLIEFCQIEEGDDFLKNVPHRHWFPHLPAKAFADFSTLVKEHALKHHIKSIVLYTDKDYELQYVITAYTLLERAVAKIWSQIFFRLEPTRVVVAAPPTTLAGLLDTQVRSSDAWAFDMKMHYIELVHNETSRIEHLSSACRRRHSALIRRRPWTHLGYNEGSSVPAYRMCGYHRQSPKMLYLTLLRLAKEVRSCCNIRSFSFVSVFPLSTNISTVMRALHKIRTLRTVQFQIAPGPENNLLSAPEVTQKLWLQWNGSYREISYFLGTFKFEDGSQFISKDCVEPRAEKQVEECLELLQTWGVGWRNDGKGVWIRDRTLDREETML